MTIRKNLLLSVVVGLGSLSLLTIAKPANAATFTIQIDDNPDNIQLFVNDVNITGQTSTPPPTGLPFTISNIVIDTSDITKELVSFNVTGTTWTWLDPIPTPSTDPVVTYFVSSPGVEVPEENIISDIGTVTLNPNDNIAVSFVSQDLPTSPPLGSRIVGDNGNYYSLGKFSFNGGADTLDIQARSLSTTPEPSSMLGLFALGTLGAASTLKRKLKPSQSTEKETTKVS